MQLSLGGEKHALAGYRRDRLHRETRRTLGSLTLATGYDMAGRVTHRRCADDARGRLVSERRYQWDRADQIVRQMQTDGTPALPEEKYRQAQWGYDAAGRMTRSVQPEADERFWWDGADNRTTAERQPVWNNMLRRLDGVAREYDGFGRMTVRRDTHRDVTQRYSYDDEDRISAVDIEGDREYARAEYRYDVLGRRTEKRVWRHGANAPERTAYAWSGMQMVGEESDARPDAKIQHVYEEGGFTPLARVESFGNAVEVYWYHAELNGLPERMTDAQGETVWRGTFSAWGRTLAESGSGRWRGQQNLRFQGQYLDRETGLHYNTLRYYDAWGGCYTQVDPFGLLGGLNTYGYVGDPLTWVDPLGLSCWGTSRKKFWKNEAKTNPGGYSKNNLELMKKGKAPRLQVEVINRKTGLPEIKDVPMELHHKNIPQRVGGENVHNHDNLDKLTPWGHEAVDPYRHTGYDFFRIIKDVDIW